MPPEATISRRAVQRLIFCGEEAPSENLETLEELEEKRLETSGRDRPSAYVQVFEDVVTTVIKGEYFLLSAPESDLLNQFSKLVYDSRFCLIRLTLRKPNQWHPVSSLQAYVKEVGEDGLQEAIEDLCKPICTFLSQTTTSSQEASQEAPPRSKSIDGPTGSEIIDLTFSDDEDEPAPLKSTPPLQPSNPPIAGPPPDRIHTLLNAGDDDGNLGFFCEDETKMTLDEILQRLNNEKLEKLVKQLKCKPAKAKSWNKADRIAALKQHASGQGVLSFQGTPKKDVGKKNKVQSKLPFATPKVNQEKRLRDMCLKELGKCIRVNFDFYRLVRRLHIMYYRGMEHPEQLFLDSLLTIFRKRSFSGYRSKRSNNIWSCRKELLEYERALELSHLLDEIMNPPIDKEKEKQRGKTPLKPPPKFKTPCTPGPGRSGSTPLKRRISDTPDLVDLRDESVFDEPPLDDDIAEVKKEKIVKGHLQEWILPNWEELVDRKREEGGIKNPALERFEPGYVYTQMLWKASKALGPLQEYDLELSVLEKLLSQTFWSRGKRGRWYERRTIVQQHLKKKYKGDAAALANHMVLIQEGLKEALSDTDTGLVYRPGFVDRLLKIENQLKIPEAEKTKCAAKLKDPTYVEFSGKKLSSTTPLRLDQYGQPFLDKENASGLRSYNFVKNTDVTPKAEPVPMRKAMGKSKWEGKDGNVVNVETLALEYYEKQGYKGMHAETRLITTIFGLLMWDIIFMDKPGAFETDFQSCPLDMFEDSFYFARQAEIEARVEEIKNGKAREILERHDDWYREKKTWCICVGWDLCTKEELVEIVECFDKNSLAQICKILCQDYKGRCSGGPDLFLWKPVDHKCKFVEVKGPGDTARQNQKLWFDALVQAGVDVEICKVLDQNQKVPPASASRKRKAKSQTPKAQKKGKKVTRDDSLSDEEDYDKLDPESEDQMPQLELAPSSAKRRRISTPS